MKKKRDLRPKRQDPFDVLVPDATPEVRRFLEQLRSHNEAIEKWMAERPDRLEELQADPPRVLTDLLRAIGLKAVPSKAGAAPNRHVRFEPQTTPVGGALLNAVWAQVSQSPQTAQAFRAAPFQTIETVATSTNASASDRSAVLAAFQQILGPAPSTIAWARIVQRVSSEQPARVVLRD